MKIIPRWEFRTFDKDITESETLVRKYEVTMQRESREIYILSKNSIDNTKIRDELMDIKTPIRIKDSLEQWTVLGKFSFPIHVNELALVFKAFNVELPYIEQDELKYEEYINLIKNIDSLEMVDVYKNRTGFIIDEAIVEIAVGTFNDKEYKTIAVEHKDPKLVKKVVEKLKLSSHENTNYIKAMKDSIWS